MIPNYFVFCEGDTEVVYVEMLRKKRTLETILIDQKKEVENWTDEHLCSRNEEKLVDISSPQVQVKSAS